MREENRKARHKEISDAAYKILAEKGYDGTSMLSIAKAAKASNETLYRWYGDKRGLFEAMVRDNAADIEEKLQSSLRNKDEPIGALANLAPVFLDMLLGDRAIMLNRAAAADPSGELGRAISAGGRDIIQPLFGDLMASQTKTSGSDAQKFTTLFLGILIGDQQIKRVIGVAEAPSKAEIKARVAMAMEALETLLENS